MLKISQNHQKFLGILSFTLLLSIVVTAAEAQAATTHFRGQTFEAYIVSDSPGRRLYETWEGSRSVLRVSEGEEYSIVVRNPLPIRVGVAVSVDGLNTIDGSSTSASRGPKWLIEPYSQITIRGWQTSGSDLRKFVFTHPEFTYAKWKEKQDRRNYTKNLGVIGIAYFWDKDELEEALYPPEPFYGYDRDSFHGLKKERESIESRSKARIWDDKAGTGMGRHERHHVTRVNFHYDTGMYSSRDVLKIYYKFGSRHPRPFPHWDRYEKEEYTPEMPHWPYRYRGNY